MPEYMIMLVLAEEIVLRNRIRKISSADRCWP